MTSVADFIKLQKVDFHNYIQLGMSYPSFVTWAGYYIPEFDDKQKRLSKEFQDDFDFCLFDTSPDFSTF